MESEIKQLHATWLRLLEVIEDLEYLQQIRELGTRDLQQLSRALSRLRARLGAVETGPESVRQYVPSPASVVVQTAEERPREEQQLGNLADPGGLRRQGAVVSESVEVSRARNGEDPTQAGQQNANSRAPPSG